MVEEKDINEPEADAGTTPEGKAEAMEAAREYKLRYFDHPHAEQILIGIDQLEPSLFERADLEHAKFIGSGFVDKIMGPGGFGIYLGHRKETVLGEANNNINTIFRFAKMGMEETLRPVFGVVAQLYFEVSAVNAEHKAKHDGKSHPHIKEEALDRYTEVGLAVARVFKTWMEKGLRAAEGAWQAEYAGLRQNTLPEGMPPKVPGFGRGF